MILGWGEPHVNSLPNPWLGTLLVTCHLALVWSYFSIAASINVIVKHAFQKDVLRSASRLLQRFIQTCGVVHLGAAIVMYIPAYGPYAAALTWAAVVSGYVAFVLAWQLRPILVKIVEAFEVMHRVGSIQMNLDRHRRTFMDAPIGILHIDHQGTVIEANHTFARWLQTESDSLTGRQFADFEHPDDLDRTLKLFGTLVDHGNTATLPTQPFQNRYVARDGSIVTLEWLRGSGNPVGHRAHVAFCVMLGQTK